MTLVVHRAAEADILEAYRWYESRRSGLGTIFVSEVDESLVRIARSPMSFALSYREMRRVISARGDRTLRPARGACASPSQTIRTAA